MKQEKIDRINALARKSRTEGLTPEEKLEQQLLRQEYISAFRASMTHAWIVKFWRRTARFGRCAPKGALPLS